MDYVAGVDLGTTYSAGAIGSDGRVEIFDLGIRSSVIPSVVLLRDDGTVLAGDAADHRSVTEASRTAREFKRRLGDTTPFLLGGTPYGAEALTGHLLEHILGAITDQQGGPAQRVLLTHPANYGEYKLGFLAEAARLAGLVTVEFVPEPVAAAAHYSSSGPLAVGELLAVYDFGGGTLDLAVVRATESGFDLVGTPEGMERFGGVDLDEAVFFHVQRSIGDAIERLDPSDPAATAALAALRVACREAKEALSADTDTAIPVMLPTVHTEVRLTRAEFEDMLRPRLRETLTVLDRVVASAGVPMEEVARILLVGGASRIPLVAEMIRGETGRPVAVDANPKYAVAMGAARLALEGEGPVAIPVPSPVESLAETESVPPEPPVEPVSEPQAVPVPEPEPPGEETSDDEEEPPSGVEPLEEAGEGQSKAGWRPGRWAAALVAVLAVAALALWFAGVFDGGDGTGATVAQAPNDEQPGPEGTEPGSVPPLTGQDGQSPLGLVYLTQFRTPDAGGDWGLWAIGGANPPEDIGSDYFPLLGPYASSDPAVLEQHMVWVRATGADLLVVDWQGSALGDFEVFGAVLETAAQNGVAVAPMIEPYPGRTPASTLGDIEDLAARFGEHPGWARGHRGSLWSDDPGRLIVFVSAPEMIDDGPGLSASDWPETTDGARTLNALVLAVIPDPAWVEGGRFDGLAFGSLEEGYPWSSELPDGAWFVPMVTPGMSTERIGEPDASREREGGANYERQWTAVGESPRLPDMVLVMSFNGWVDGTQIEPASDQPPDPRYRTYEPLEPISYLDLTRELADRFIGPRE